MFLLLYKFCLYEIVNCILLHLHSQEFSQQDAYVSHFQPMIHFYSPWKYLKTSNFLMFSGGIEMEY